MRGDEGEGRLERRMKGGGGGMGEGRRMGGCFPCLDERRMIVEKGEERKTVLVMEEQVEEEGYGRSADLHGPNLLERCGAY